MTSQEHPISDATTQALDRITDNFPESVSGSTDAVKARVADLGEKADHVTTHVADAVSAGKDGASDVLGTAAENAQDVAHEAARQARDLLDEARTQVSQQAGEQHKKAAESLRSLSEQLAAMSRNGGQDGLAVEVVGQASDRMRTAADWLEQREPGEIVDEVRAFARRRPGMFLLGAVVAGVAAGRLTRGVVAVHGDSSPADAPTGGTTASLGADSSLVPSTYEPPVMDGDSAAYPTEVIGYSSPSESGVGYQPTTEREPEQHSYSGATGRVTP